MKITEESLECSECDWRGAEDDALLHLVPDGDDFYECPACRAECAHFPLDEIGQAKVAATPEGTPE